MNQQVNKQEIIVGWWATGHTVTSHSSVIHEYYSRECVNPVHMTLDTTLKRGHLGLKAFIKWDYIQLKILKIAIKFCKQFLHINVKLSVPVGVPGGKQGSCFTPINVEVISYEPEVVSRE